MDSDELTYGRSHGRTDGPTAKIGEGHGREYWGGRRGEGEEEGGQSEEDRRERWVKEKVEVRRER
jgi:hypothetical protein